VPKQSSKATPRPPSLSKARNPQQIAPLFQPKAKPSPVKRSSRIAKSAEALEEGEEGEVVVNEEDETGVAAEDDGATEAGAEAEDDNSDETPSLCDEDYHSEKSNDDDLDDGDDKEASEAEETGVAAEDDGATEAGAEDGDVTEGEDGGAAGTAEETPEANRLRRKAEENAEALHDICALIDPDPVLDDVFDTLRDRLLDTTELRERDGNLVGLVEAAIARVTVQRHKVLEHVVALYSQLAVVRQDLFLLQNSRAAVGSAVRSHTHASHHNTFDLP
jgi:hypothetical protein